MAAFNLYIFYRTPLGETAFLGNPYFIYWLPKHTYGYLPLTVQ